MPEFQVRFISELYLGAEQVTLYHVVVLPFVPTVGMTIFDGDWSCLIDKLSYDVNGGFEAYARVMLIKTKEHLEERIQDSLTEGWRLLWRSGWLNLDP